MDFSAGGTWDFVMRGPDGHEYRNRIRFLEIRRPHSIRCTHLGDGEGAKDVDFEARVTFEESGEGTRLTFEQMTERAILRARLAYAVLAFVTACAAPGRTRQPDASDVTADDVFVIRHVFAADPKAVFDAWAEPERLARWMGPSGARMAFRSADVIEGGASQWTMTTPDGLTKHGRLRFKIIDSPRLFVYAQDFTDEDGKPARLPTAAPYPETLLTTVRFAWLGQSGRR